MDTHLIRRMALLAMPCFAACAVTAVGADRISLEQPFLDGNQKAMDKMMDGMAAHPTGDIDNDFAAMMIPHHQGAIDMAILELRYGHNQQLLRIAQEIIVDQQQEINAMHLALGQTLLAPAPAPTQVGDGYNPGANQASPIASHPMKEMQK